MIFLYIYIIYNLYILKINDDFFWGVKVITFQIGSTLTISDTQNNGNKILFFLKEKKLLKKKQQHKVYMTRSLLDCHGKFFLRI